MKQFMEGKASVVSNLSEEANKEDLSVNKVGVHKFRYPVKNSPFYIYIKIMDKIAHCCLIDGVLRTKYQYSIEKPQKKYSTP
jgi:hypothetical protein